MMLHTMKVLALPQIFLCLVLASLSALAAAQTPVKPAKPHVLPVAKSSGKTSASAQATAQAQARAAAEATAQVQAQAIAEAAASLRARSSVPVVPGVPGVSTRTNTTALPNVPATATLAAPSVGGHLASEPAALADQVHQGHLPCEMGASVRVEADAAQPGYFHVQGKGFKYHMHRVRTSTGAIRLEDTKAGAVWLQLANKSMLMDQTKGRRVADECAHPDQVAYAKSMKTNPPPSLFDTTGMGRPKN